MSQWEAPVEAVAAGVGASVTILVFARQWFRRAVQEIVERSQADLIRKLNESERRQDARLDRIERKLNNQRPRLDGPDCRPRSHWPQHLTRQSA